MRTQRNRHAASAQRGSITVTALIAVVVLFIVCGGALATSLARQKETGSAVARHGADFAADAGVAHAITNLTNGDTGNIGDEVDPLGFGGGAYWAEVVDNGDDTYTVTSTGQVRTELSRVEARLEPVGGGIYWNAVFAGNSSGDPLYELDMGGLGEQADFIEGDIYSGGDARISGDATVTGTIRAGESIYGASGEEGYTQPIPDLGAMNYPNTADFDVAEMFDAGSSYTWDNAGGNAWQLPESSPAHIFRKNPSDRTANTSSTEKDDFFLEDPYEPVRLDPEQNGSDPYTFSLSGVAGESGPNSDGKVFYIDGNLWLHNKKTYSLGLKNTVEGGVQATFIVKGNIYFSDNMFYKNEEMDGLAFIAMKDEGVEDSGNIYFGDPVYGTLQKMYAFMYAENNFYDLNLDESGSQVVELFGNMTAGNQVVIKRNYGEQHTKLHVDFDDRVSTGSIEIPGLPGLGSGSTQKYVVAYWHRITPREFEP